MRYIENNPNGGYTVIKCEKEEGIRIETEYSDGDKKNGEECNYKLDDKLELQLYAVIPYREGNKHGLQWIEENGRRYETYYFSGIEVTAKQFDKLEILEQHSCPYNLTSKQIKDQLIRIN